MSHLDPVAPPTRRELRSFALTVGAAFLAFAALALRRGRHATAAVFGALGAALVVAGVAVPQRLGAVHRAWTALAEAMSRVTTPLFMAVIYFCVLTPFGLAMRLAGRRSMTRRPDAGTYWVPRPEGARRGDLRRQF